MTMTDPIADMLTRIRNGLQARMEAVQMPASKVKKSILDVLVKEGYIRGYNEIKDKDGHPALEVELKYYNGVPVIQEIQRMSKPGLRSYSNKHDIPVIREGLGMAIISTSKGVMSDANAREMGIGGEVICRVF